MFFLVKLFLKSASKLCFFSFGVEISGFGAAISSAVARSSIVFCNSVSADRSVRAASRLLGATAACIILLSFAAGHRKLWWSGCIEAAIVFSNSLWQLRRDLVVELQFRSTGRCCAQAL